MPTTTNMFPRMLSQTKLMLLRLWKESPKTSRTSRSLVPTEFLTSRKGGPLEVATSAEVLNESQAAGFIILHFVVLRTMLLFCLRVFLIFLVGLLYLTIYLAIIFQFRFLVVLWTCHRNSEVDPALIRDSRWEWIAGLAQP